MATTACNITFFMAIVLFFERFSLPRFSLRHLALVPALVFLSAFSLPALAQMNDDYIQKAYIAFFNRPADVPGLNHWKNYSGNAQDLLTEFSNSAEYLSDFDGLNNVEILTRVYWNLFGRTPDDEGLTYWAVQMGMGYVTIANVAYEVLGGARNEDEDIITNKVLAANMFTGALDTSEKVEAYNNAGSIGLGNMAKNWLAAVNGQNTSVETAEAILGTLLNNLVEDEKELFAYVLTIEEMRLYHLIMEYRKEQGLSEIPISSSLTYVAHTHVNNLQENHIRETECNMHSWYDTGNWIPCCYTADHAQAACMWRKPSELTSYTGNGYEIAYMHSYLATPESALRGWQESSGHNAVILNEDSWKNITWNAIGIGIYKNFAVVWFGKENE